MITTAQYDDKIFAVVDEVNRQQPNFKARVGGGGAACTFVEMDYNGHTFGFSFDGPTWYGCNLTDDGDGQTILNKALEDNVTDIAADLMAAVISWQPENA